MPANFTRKALLLFICCCYTLAAIAHTGSMRGIVYDGVHKKPLEGVTVYIKKANSSAVTDALGRFFIKDLPKGDYIVVLSYIGYETISNEITIDDGVTTDNDYNLQPASVKMSEVSINAKKDLDLSSISGLDLKARPINNTQDMMRLVPGLFTAQHQGGGKAEQLFLRGFDADHGTDINVSVDGMPVNMVSHAHGQGFADTHFIIPETVQEIDFGKGPYSIDKGDFATAGWVSFKTKNYLDNSFVKVDGGSFGYFRTVMGLDLIDKNTANGRQTAYIAGEYGYNRSYFDEPQDFNRLNLIGKYTNYLSKDKIFSLTLSGFSTTWNASGQIPTRAVTEGIINRFGDIDPEGGVTSRYNVNLQYYQSINEHSSFKSNIFFTYYQFSLYSDFTFFLRDTVNGDQIHQAEKRAIAGYSSEYNNSYSYFGVQMKAQAGLGFRYDNVMNDELGHTIDKWKLLGDSALGNVHETNMYAYINQRIYILPQLVATIGTRFDYFVQQYENKLSSENLVTTSYPHAFSPKASLYYNFGDRARIYYNYGIGFHSNDTRTIASAGQGTNVPVQYVLPLASSMDLGVIVKLYSKLLLSAAIWGLDLQQEFTYDGDVSIVLPSGRTRRQGLDFSLRYELVKWLYLDADLNFARARYLDSPTGHNYVPLAAGFTSIGGVMVKLNKNLSASLRFRHMADRPANETNTITAPGYTICDAVVNYIRPKYELGLQLQNLFNVQWDEAAFATETRLRSEVVSGLPGQTDLCFTPGTPFFLKLSAMYKF